MQRTAQPARPASAVTVKRIGIHFLALVAVFALLAGCSTTAPAATESPATDVAATEVAAAEPAPTESKAVAEALAPETSTESSATATTFRIVPEGTEARFMIDEILMGAPKTVVGITSQVEGTITVDPADLGTTQVSAIRINARDLTTDDDRRNGQLRRRILQSDQDKYQYITFQPTSFEGLPAAGAAGETFTFRVVGDLTILDKTVPVTFDMTVTANSATELTGTGTATVRYADFGISIPSVPFVAGVGEDVKLELAFKANAEG